MNCQYQQTVLVLLIWLVQTQNWGKKKKAAAYTLLSHQMLFLHLTLYGTEIYHNSNHSGWNLLWMTEQVLK